VLAFCGSVRRSADDYRYDGPGVLQLTRGSRAILKVSPDYVGVAHSIAASSSGNISVILGIRHAGFPTRHSTERCARIRGGAP
jgi:hypothetical protein